MNVDFIMNDPLSAASYTLLLLAILSLWIRQDFRVWGFIALISLVCGFLAVRIDAIGMGSIVVLGSLFFVVIKKDLRAPFRLIASLSAIILSIALATHIIPGFNNWKVIDNVFIGDSSQSYSVYLNLDKPMVGLIILGFGFPLVNGIREWATVFKTSFFVLTIGLFVLLGVIAVLDHVRWDLKFPDIFLVWSLKMLFFTCVSEEAFFRGFLQKTLSKKWKSYRYGSLFSLLTVSCLFGVAHFTGGIRYVALSVVAGVVYGYAYHKTQRIEAAIICHFGVNMFRFLCLTYPGMM